MPNQSEGSAAAEALVLVGYASLMESVQNFEWALKRMGVQKDESLDSFSFDDAWKRTEKILHEPMGALEGAVPRGLAADLPRLRRIRNKLAHEILMLWRFETNLDLVTHDEVVDSFVELSNEFDAYAAELDQLADEHLVEIGVDPADLNPSAAGLRRMLNDSTEEADGS